MRHIEFIRTQLKDGCDLSNFENDILEVERLYSAFDKKAVEFADKYPLKDSSMSYAIMCDNELFITHSIGSEE